MRGVARGKRLCPGAAVLSAVISLVLVAAGCGGGADGTGVAHLATTTTRTTSNSTVYRVPPTKAVLYAASACMRKHGVPNFPNPIFILGKYRFGFTSDSDVDPHTPQFQAAERYCMNRYLDPNKPFSPAQLAQWHTQALKYAQCIRANGLKIFPDPPPVGQNSLNGPEILLPGSLPQNLLGTPAWLHAQRACKSLSRGIAVAWSG
jgi:hypothetical protein